MSTRPEASPTDPARLAEASRVLAEWFETDAPPHEPANLLSATLWRTARTRRRAPWRNPERWLPMTIALRPAVLPRVALILALMVTLVIAVGGALYFASSPPTTPRPLLSPGPSAAAMPALTGVTAISAGSANCALVAGGKVRCWGPNYVGQLGDGTTVDSPVPVEVSGIEGATVLVGGPGTTCAVVAGGVVRCWGSIGSDFNDSRLPIDMPELQGATALVMRTNDPCIPLADGALRCRKHIEVPGLAGATTIIGTDQETTCALMADGRVECWGRLRGGSLGDGLTEESQTPIVAKGVEGATAIALGQSQGMRAGHGRSRHVLGCHQYRGGRGPAPDRDRGRDRRDGSGDVRPARLRRWWPTARFAAGVPTATVSWVMAHAPTARRPSRSRA